MSLLTIIATNTGGSVAGGGGEETTPLTKLTGIGDSIMDGSLGTSTAPLSQKFIAVAANALGVPFTIHGHSGYTTLQLAPLINTEVVPDAPSHCLIEGGVNDQANNHPEYTVTYFTSMIDDLLAAGIVPIIFLTLPWTTTTDARNRSIDANNETLINLANTTYAGQVLLIDPRATMCEFKTGGDEGNLWKIKDAYDCGDGLHYTVEGYAAMGDYVASQLAVLT